VEAVTVCILLPIGRGRRVSGRRVIRRYWALNRPTISGACVWAQRCTSATLREASGLGKIVRRTSGMPSAAARACAARVKALVSTLTDGTPCDSVRTVSWRPHAVQEPQSAMPWMMASHSRVNVSMVSVAQGAL
jgi:hypothetical protein